MTQAQPGEQLVGAYLRVIERCDLVTYNQRSMEQGDQMELDVLGVKSILSTSQSRLVRTSAC
jgi:hypothetical protein